MLSASWSRQSEAGAERAKLLPVFFMFLSLGSMLLCLALITFAQGYVTYVFCALVYALLVGIEKLLGIRSPVSISMFALYLLLALIHWHTDQYRGYVGIVVFAWLSVLTSILLARRTPFTAFYSGGRGMRQIHYLISGIWTCTYLVCLLVALLLIPDVLYLVIPTLLCVAAGVLTVVFNLAWCGPRHAYLDHCRVGDFDFQRIAVDGPQFRSFCDFYAAQIHRPDEPGEGKSLAEIVASIAQAERLLGDDSHLFVAFHRGTMVGCIRAVVDRPERPFPLEHDMQFSFQPLREIGRVLYVGRLAIDAGYRERPDILNGLFKCFVDLALREDVAFVLAEGFPHRIPTYLKLGFEILFTRSDPRHAVRMSHGYICHPLVLNFASLIFYHSNSGPGKFNFSPFLNRYLLERWYKRMALRFALRPAALWPWRCGVQDIRGVLTQLTRVNHES